MTMKKHSLIIVLIFPLLLHQYQCVILGEEETKLLDEIVEEFKKSPTDSKYDHVIHLPINKANLIPKVFIWCPIMHYKLALRCPLCNSQFKVQSFSKFASSLKNRPRLIYDVGGNILLIQSYYVCMNRDKQHSYMSATSEILDKLPGNTAKKLPFILHYKSGFSNDLLDFLLISVNQGHTFQEVVEMIGSLNYRKFVERNNLAGAEAAKEFQENMLYSFATGDKLMHVFLWNFEHKKEAYKHCLNSVSCKTLIIDTSYKMEKRCKVKGQECELFEDCMHLDNLFLALNENGEVLSWKPIKSKDFKDFQDILLELKQRLDSNGQELSAILVSDCCFSRARYQQVFPTVPVKMGIVHAIKLITDTLPKEHPDTMVFAHKLLQIFSCSTTDDQRSEETVSPLDMEVNLDSLLSNWRSQLSESTMEALDNLRYHMRQGCLSGIPPGEGTEKVDALHRHIQKSFFARVTVITPQMAFAIFTCLLYAWNCKKQTKDLFKGKKVIPVRPIEAYDRKTKSSSTESVGNIKIDVKSLTDNSGMEPLVIECYQQNNSCSSILVVTADVVEYMFVRLLHIQDLITSFKEKCKKSFSVSEFPIFSSNLGITQYLKLIPQTTEQEINSETLQKNLAEYGLQLDKIQGDGNCLFRSIVHQVEKLTQLSPELKTFLESIGMGKTPDEDTHKLRELFVKELQANFVVYKEWIDLSNTNFEKELEKFSEDGFFASDIGDLCIKVCGNVLQVPIIVITSIANAKFIPFLPTKFISSYPIYIAFNHSAPGHYDATQEIKVPDPSENKCRCGRQSKYRKEATKIACDPNDTRCPCVAASLPCVYCQCFNCHNKPVEGTPLSCKCNASRRRNDKRACLNEERISCCCKKAGFLCTVNCSCHGCGNGKPKEKREKCAVDGETPRKRPRKGYKLLSSIVKEEAGDVAMTTEWSEQEMICLMVCREVLAACNVEENAQNISQVYSYIARSKNNVHLGLSIGIKDLVDIQNKLNFLQIGIALVTQLVAVTTDTVTAHTVTTDTVMADTVVTHTVTTDTVSAHTITADTVSAHAVMADTVMADVVTSDTTTTDMVTSDTTTTNIVTADTVTSDTVTADTVTSDTVTADTVTTDTVTADTVTSDTVTVDTVTADTVTSDTVTADTVTTDTVTADTVTTDMVTTDTVTTDTVTAFENQV